MIQQYSIAEAADQLILSGYAGTRHQASDRIRAAASRKSIEGAEQDPTGHWHFDAEKFQVWLKQISDEKRGRPRK